jgi:Zn-dependent protease with chaperone function
MNAASFLLTLWALAVATAWLVSGLSRLALPFVRRLSPTSRMEASTWLTVVPVLAAMVVSVAVSVPSVRYGLGLGADHCAGHAHHAHVCFWHGAALPAWMAWIAAIGGALTLFRVAQVAAGLVRTERVAAALSACGTEHDGVVVVPSTRVVCHVVGVLRPRIVVSRAVVDGLGAGELRAAIAHERAHLDRSDSRWSALLAIAGSVAPLSSASWVRVWREAAEEAADGVAASMTDGPTVARSLVAVARMGLQPIPGLAFHTADLERQVTRLLEGSSAPRSSRAGRGTVLLAVLAATLVVAAHVPLHHLIEEAWEVTVGH